MFFDIHTHSNIRNSKVTSIYNAGETLIEEGYFSVGIHPYESANSTISTSAITDIAQQENCLAIGEIGLDKLIETPMRVQQNVFESQLQVSEMLEMPVIIHCVKAWNELQRIKRSGNYQQQWIFHGFRKVGILESLLAENMGISIGAALLFDSKLQAVIHEIPLEQLYLESDTSDVEIEAIYEKTASLLQFSMETLCTLQRNNFERTFKKFKKGV